MLSFFRVGWTSSFSILFSAQRLPTFPVVVSYHQVSVIPTPSTDFTLVPLSGDGYTSCLCANERKTVSWSMAPSVLGQVQLLTHTCVKPEEYHDLHGKICWNTQDVQHLFSFSRFVW